MVETLGKSTDCACLYISGAVVNVSFWSDALCENLAQRGFYVIRYDHRDFGYSSRIDYETHPYVTMDLVGDALQRMDALHVSKAHMIGHSMGGFIAQLLAIRNPDRVLSMTSISSSTHSPDIPSPPEKTWEVLLKNNPKNNVREDLNGFIQVWKYLNGTARFDREMAVEYTANLYARQDIYGALGASMSGLRQI